MISFQLYIQLPSSNWSVKILFLLRRFRIVVWKNFVLASPCDSQFILDLNFQNSSSLFNTSLKFIISFFSRSSRKELFGQFGEFWIPCNLFNSFLFSWKILPKVTLDHLVTSDSKLVIAFRRLALSCEALSTILMKSGCEVHIISNLKGFDLPLLTLLFNDNNNGQWSEWVLRRCCTWELGQLNSHSLFAKKQSKRSKIREFLFLNLLLSHV